MRKQQVRRSSGARSVAFDTHVAITRYRLIQLMALLLSAVFALSLHLIFGH